MLGLNSNERAWVTCLKRARLLPFSPYTERITFSGTMISTVVFVTIADLLPLQTPNEGVR